MRNIPDNRVSTTARFELPEENSATIRKGFSYFSDTAALRETEKNITPEKPARKTYPAENTHDAGLLDDLKSGGDSISEYLHNILLEVKLDDGISEFTTEIYRKITDLITSENLSPSGAREALEQGYGEIKALFSEKHKNGSPEQEYHLEEKLDQKISVDKQYIESLYQNDYQKKAFGTIDHLAKKYGHGVTQSPETLTDAMIAIEDTVNKLAPGIGRDGAITKIKDTRGMLFSNALQGYAGQKNYIALQSLLDGIDPVTNARLNSGDYITSEERDYFQNLAGKGLRREAAYQLLDEIEAQVISTDELLDALQNHPDSSLGKEALSLWQNRKRIEKKVTRNRVKKQRYTVWQNITETNGNVDVTDLPLDLSDEDRDIFISYLVNKDDLNMGLYDPKDLGAKIPDVLFYEIKKLQIANPDIFTDRDLSDYFRGLSPKQIAGVMAMQENGLDPKDAASFKMREREALRVWKQVTGRNGYDEPDRQDFINFSIRFGEEIDDLNAFEERSASAADINQIANRMIENGEVISLENVGEAVSDGEQEFFENESDSGVDFSTTAEAISIEEEFNNLIEKQVVLPKGVTATFVEDEQTALDDKHTGKPSYNVVFHDANGNLIDGPATMKRLPGEPNEQSHLRYVPGEGFFKDQPRNKKQYNLASTAARDYIYGIRGRHPINEDEEKEIFLLAENIYGIIREEYGDENHIPQGEIYTMIDDLAAEGKAPRLNGYKPPTTQLGRDLEKYYKETNVFGRFRDGFMYGWNNIGLGLEITSAFNHLENKRELDAVLPLLEQQYFEVKKALNGQLKSGLISRDEYRDRLISRKIFIENNKYAAYESMRLFRDNIKDAAEYQKLIEEGKRNPVLKAIEESKNLDESWKLFSMDPMGVIGQVVLENSVKFAATTGVGLAGAAIGQPVAGAALEATITAALEYAEVLKEKLLEAGADLNDPESVQKIMLERSDEFKQDAVRSGLFAGSANMLGSTMGELVKGAPLVKEGLEKIDNKSMKMATEDVVSGASSMIVENTAKSEWEKRNSNLVK